MPNFLGRWDFVMDRTADGRPIKMLTLIDEFTKEVLAIYRARRIRSHNVIDILADVMIERGVPKYIRSDYGPELVAKKLRQWLRSSRCQDTVHHTRMNRPDFPGGPIT
jgi:putative transposase